MKSAVGIKKKNLLKPSRASSSAQNWQSSNL